MAACAPTPHSRPRRSAVSSTGRPPQVAQASPPRSRHPIASAPVRASDSSSLSGRGGDHIGEIVHDIRAAPATRAAARRGHPRMRAQAAFQRVEHDTTSHEWVGIRWHVLQSTRPPPRGFDGVTDTARRARGATASLARTASRWARATASRYAYALRLRATASRYGFRYGFTLRLDDVTVHAGVDRKGAIGRPVSPFGARVGGALTTARK